MGMWRRMTNRWRRTRVSAEIDEELAAHLAMAEEDRKREEFSPEEAHRAARVRFGNVDRLREQAHRADVALPFDGWRTALRATLRGLRRSPGFTATVVLTLALGIGATTALFTLVYDVMLKPLPFPHPGRLVVIQEKVKEIASLYPAIAANANHFRVWTEENRSFSAMTEMLQSSAPLGASDHPVQVGVLRATAGFFDTLGVQPRLGRKFTAAETQPGRDRVAILTDSLWKEQFQGSLALLGRTVTLDGYSYTIIGVMPPYFHMPAVKTMSTTNETDLRLNILTPLALTKEQLSEQMGEFNYYVLGRLKAGVSLPEARSALDLLQQSISQGLPADEKATLSIVLTPFSEVLIRNDRRPLLVLLFAVFGLLLVACVNIANLLLVRSVAQRKQMAVISALGAGRSAIFRMALRETALLAAFGGTLGICVAAALLPWMQLFLPAALSFREPLHMDLAGIVCALLLGTAAMFVSGGVPALIATRVPPQQILQSDARLASESRNNRRVRRVLVGIEAALGMALLLLTALLIASVEALLREPRGFSTDHTVTATLSLPIKQYSDQPNRASFYRNLLTRLEVLPGVENVALTSVLPLTGNKWADVAERPGNTLAWTRLPVENFRFVSPSYFKTLNLRLLHGRFFDEEQRGRNVAVISEATARQVWPGENAIGQTFYRGGSRSEAFTVVGIAGNTRTLTLVKDDPPTIYVPYWYRADNDAGLIIRTSQNPTSMADSIRKVIWSIDPGIPVPATRTLGALVSDSVADRRFERNLLELFAASALLLAALGVYGVVSYSVEQRRREIGLRLALGAPRASMYTMVLRDGMPPVGAGVCAGILLVYALARVLRALLFGITVYDPWMTLGAAALLLTLAVISCLLPARRAARVEPSEALRAE